MIFCGDYVDRGYHGAEVFALVLTLRARNPERVFLAHGNHEDRWLNEAGGLLDELVAKFGRELGLGGRDRATALDAFGAVFDAYETLPQALFVGVQQPTAGAGGQRHRRRHQQNEYDERLPQQQRSPTAGGAPVAAYVMAAHGGVEFGVDPGPFLRAPVAGGRKISSGGKNSSIPAAVVEHALVREVLRAQWLAAQPAAARHKLRAGAGTSGAAGDPFRDWRGGAAIRHSMDPGIGFQWADFFVHDAATPLRYARGRGFAVGRPVAESWMASAGVAAITRAHQHHDDRVKGDMLRALRGGRGLHDNWGRSGRVLTLISGANVPYLDLPFDSFLLLDLAGTAPATWAMTHCVGVARAPLPAGGGSGSSICDHDAVISGVDCAARAWTPMRLDLRSFGEHGEGRIGSDDELRV